MRKSVHTPPVRNDHRRRDIFNDSIAPPTHSSRDVEHTPRQESAQPQPTRFNVLKTLREREQQGDISMNRTLESNISDDPDVVAQAGLVSQHNIYVSLSAKDAT